MTRPAMLTRPPSVPGSPIFSSEEPPRHPQVQRYLRATALNQKRLSKTLRLPRCLRSLSSQRDVPQELQRELLRLRPTHPCVSQPAPIVPQALTSSPKTTRSRIQRQEESLSQRLRRNPSRRQAARGAWSGCGRSSSCCSARPSSSPCTPSAPGTSATLPCQGSPLTQGKHCDTILLRQHDTTGLFSGIMLTTKLLEWSSPSSFFSGCWNSSALEKRFTLTFFYFTR